MDRLLTYILRSVSRIFPDCQTLAQAIAFNMFLAFFPMLLLVLAVLSSRTDFRHSVVGTSGAPACNRSAG